MRDSHLFNYLLFSLTCPHTTKTSIDVIRWNCGNEGAEGVDELKEWRDWSNMETTTDQKRIETVLSSLELSKKTILHIGVGNSQFVLKFCHLVKAIDGITIQKGEAEKARSLSIPGYRVFLLNKYSSQLLPTLGRRYDYIVDNNPTRYACCRKHFFRMMYSYRRLLKPGGMILTDKLGLSAAMITNNPRWQIKPEEWFKIGRKFKFSPQRFDENVFALRLVSRSVPSLPTDTRVSG